MKIRLPIIVVLMMSCFSLFANSTIGKILVNEEEVIDFDENEIYSAFDKIDDAVQYISSNDKICFENLEAEDFYTPNIIKSTTAFTNLQSPRMTQSTFNSFLWGCLFGPVGIIVVTLSTDKNKDEIIKSIKGCVTLTGCLAISYVAVFRIFILYFESYY